MAQRNDEHVREVEKLRVQIQSMEEEIRRLYQSRYQLDQATKQNEKLVSTLQEAKTLYEKIGSKNKTLRIFTAEEGGTEHCQVDNRQLGIDCVGDWILANT